MRFLFRRQMNLFLAACLVVAQLSFVVHESELEEHVADGNCEVCLHSLSDKTSVNSIEAFDSETFSQVIHLSRLELPPILVTLQFQARAPPLLV